MRLLQFQTTGNLSLVEFLGTNVPPYAILSHTWGPSDEEVSYHDVVSGTWREKPTQCKLTFCREQAAKDGLDYFWIDTCCIDKSSSADLSEAINSMFAWYQNAAVCYAFLSDVHHDRRSIALSASKWFTRGWTLQELLAPRRVVFYSSEWKALGSKEELKAQLHSITKIPTEALEGTPLSHFSIAQRMSWAANRVTTRIEDCAYSLMGIFDVNMPLLYGEKEKAFLRLQQHILQDSTDQSLFAWEDRTLGKDDETGLLARSPKHFESSGNFKALGPWSYHDSSSIEPDGVRAELWLISANEYCNGEAVYKASLACSIGSAFHTSPAIYLACISGHKPKTGRYHTQYVRIRANKLEELTSANKLNGRHCIINVRHERAKSRVVDPIPLDTQVFRIGWEWGSRPEIVEQCSGYRIFPTSCWNPQTALFTASPSSGAIGVIVNYHKYTATWVAFGVGPSGSPWVKAVSATESDWARDETGKSWPLWKLPIVDGSDQATFPIPYSSVSYKVVTETRRLAVSNSRMFVITMSDALGGK
ncbi:heterokaryon incompatibility protein-domain-containing protein [Paraphoma chrysanthemicola]|nr:heterokaryon incompatibility protein-domain-containing protein [Paraphoma chrysanthemicola]